jgi:hypothetical protein
MAILQAISLRRTYGTVVPDHLPNEVEFHALAMVLKGVDQLLAGEEPTDPEFIEYVLGSREIQRRILELMPAAGKAQ